MDDGVKYPLCRQAITPAIRGSTWMVREKCKVRCVHARIVGLGSWSCMCLGRRQFDWACPSASCRPMLTSCHYQPLARCSLRLLSDLVDFESLGGYAVELVAGASCADINHNRTCFAATTDKKTHAFPSGISIIEPGLRVHPW